MKGILSVESSMYFFKKTRNRRESHMGQAALSSSRVSLWQFGSNRPHLDPPQVCTVAWHRSISTSSGMSAVSSEVDTQRRRAPYPESDAGRGWRFGSLPTARDSRGEEHASDEKQGIDHLPKARTAVLYCSNPGHMGRTMLPFD